MKVYCKDCKNYHYGDYGDWCSVSIGFEDTYVGRHLTNLEPQIYNKSNNCKYYRYSRWKRFTLWVGRIRHSINELIGVVKLKIQG